MKNKDFTEDELLALHDITAYAVTHWRSLSKFLDRNKPEKKEKIIEAIGKTEGGAELIGKVYRKLEAVRATEDS